jgi:hypothetical protein
LRLAISAVAHHHFHRYIPHHSIGWNPMRAEAQAIVDDIKQSVGLLRRHL